MDQIDDEIDNLKNNNLPKAIDHAVEQADLLSS